jgi:hypothetical protein
VFGSPLPTVPARVLPARRLKTRYRNASGAAILP